MLFHGKHKGAITKVTYKIPSEVKKVMAKRRHLTFFTYTPIGTPPRFGKLICGGVPDVKRGK